MSAEIFNSYLEKYYTTLFDIWNKFQISIYPNKPNDCDVLSIFILKISGKSIC